MFILHFYCYCFLPYLLMKLPILHFSPAEYELLIDLDLWANSVSFVQTFQWVWTDSYLCILVTRAGFHRGITPLIGRLCCVQVKGPTWRKSKWLCPKRSVTVSLCLLSCWYKELCVEDWCDVWICLCSARQPFLLMYVCACIWGGEGEGEYEVDCMRLNFCEKTSELRLFWTKFPTAGAHFSQEYYPFLCPMSVVVLRWDAFNLNSFYILVTISDILWTSYVSVFAATCTKAMKTTITGCT